MSIILVPFIYVNVCILNHNYSVVCIYLKYLLCILLMKILYWRHKTHEDRKCNLFSNFVARPDASFIWLLTFITYIKLIKRDDFPFSILHILWRQNPLWKAHVKHWNMHMGEQPKKEPTFFFFFCIVQNKFHVFASVIHSKNIIEWACRFT